MTQQKFKINHVNRNISAAIQSLALARNKMAFISGPRQCGKTTLAKQLLKYPELYFNWDQVSFKRQWQKDNTAIANIALAKQDPVIILDEIHKHAKWKNQIKGFYDNYGDKIKIIVTGSAHLNIFRKGADSLLGRFLHFNLLPFSLNEILNEETFDFIQFKLWLHKPAPLTINKKNNEAAEVLFKYGGFPEPFKAQSEQIHNLWSKSRIELMIRQDLRDLSHILNIGQVEVLASFLPERIGSPLSKQSLVEDLDVAHTTLTRWLTALNSVYYHYEIKPYSKSIARSLKKEGKLYLYDWSSIESIGPKFENFIACQLLKLIHYYNNTGHGDLQLHYLRDKEKNEVDFLVTNKQKPLFTVEAKVQDLVLDTTFRKFQKHLMVPHFQIVQPAGVFRKFMNEAAPAYVISFGSFFENLP